jgi:hypothetical protein
MSGAVNVLLHTKRRKTHLNASNEMPVMMRVSRTVSVNGTSLSVGMILGKVASRRGTAPVLNTLMIWGHQRWIGVVSAMFRCDNDGRRYREIWSLNDSVGGVHPKTSFLACGFALLRRAEVVTYVVYHEAVRCVGARIIAGAPLARNSQFDASHRPTRISGYVAHCVRIDRHVELRPPETLRGNAPFTYLGL